MKAYMFPGQGAQKKGMGRELFALFPELVEQIDDILGYSIESLCIEDPKQQLNYTQFTQPALFVVNALSYLKSLNDNHGTKADYYLGHSLGEYNALWASGVFDFETGLRLVQKRGQLMSTSQEGGMAAVIGMASAQVEALLHDKGLQDISIANYNSHLQLVLSGAPSSIARARDIFLSAGAKHYISLNVTGAFHCCFMSQSVLEFTNFLSDFVFTAPNKPVIANLNAIPYADDIAGVLAKQIDHPVLWLQSICYLLDQENVEFIEIGPGSTLTKLVSRIVDGQ